MGDIKHLRGVTDRHGSDRLEESSFKPIPEDDIFDSGNPKNAKSTFSDAKKGKISKHKHQASVVSMQSQPSNNQEEDMFNNSSVISTGHQLPGGQPYPQAIRLPVIPDVIPDSMNVLANNQVENEDFMYKLYH